MRRAISVLLVGVTVVCSMMMGSGRSRAADTPTRVYLPNIVKMLGGADGWNTPFIVQNIGNATTDVLFEFFRFSDGGAVKTRRVTGLAPGTSVFHSPNHDDELAAGGQYSVVLTAFSSPVVAVVNEHQSEGSPGRQEALSYEGLTTGSTKVFLPRVAALVDGWYCTVITQNLSIRNASVTAEFKSFDGVVTAHLLRAIPGLGSKFIDPRVETGLVIGKEYAVSLASSEPIGVVVNCHNDDASVARPRAYSYNGVLPTGDRQVFVPHTANSVAGRTTRLIVQNTGVTAARPRLTVFFLGGTGTGTGIEAPSAIAPGAVWTFNVGSLHFAFEFSAVVEGGQFAVLAETLSASSAMAYTGNAEPGHRLYLPNITRTLGGPDGWTTPFVVQSHGAFAATLRWYRFADGVLVHTQRVLFDNGFGYGVKIDPRNVRPLVDGTQYAVAIEASFGGVGAAVLEINDRGGDSAMAYGAMTLPPTEVIGLSGCSPAVAPAGSVFLCTFYGLPVGARPVKELFSPSGFSGTVDDQIPSDGRWTVNARALIAGTHTITVTAGSVSRTASYTVTAPTFAVKIVQSTNGTLRIESKPDATCRAEARLPSGNLSSAATLKELRTVDAAGLASWVYPADGESGSGLHYVECNWGSETLVAGSPYNLP